MCNPKIAKEAIKIRKKNNGFKCSKKAKKIHRNVMIKRKKNGEFNLKPNKSELFLLNILNQIYPKQWKFTGNGKIWINYQNPDFIHKKHKKVIELFGEYWHEKKEQRQRINKFKKEGYDCLVIWHDKDKLWKEPENVVNKIISWNQS